MSVLWTRDTAVAATGGSCAVDWQATGVSIDTRSLKTGDLFVALNDVRDGHDFVAQALENGAAAALVSRVPDGVSPDSPLLLVPDVLAALGDMARAARARVNAKVIGVTGSVGKTGTKEMLRTALAPFGKVHAAVRSFNNHWGVPLTLARMPQDTEFAVIEIGMNHPGEITPLAQMADLDVAIVTTVAAVHMAAFKDVTEIAMAKAEIFDGLRRGGAAVLNVDTDSFDLLADAATRAGATVVSFGQRRTADVQMVSARIHGAMTTVDARFNGLPALFKLAAPGQHLAMNALAALAAVLEVGGDLAEAMLALANWQAPDGRGARHTVDLSNGDGQTLELIDESYNANPTSMRAALEVLAAATPQNDMGWIKTGRRIAFLGDMLELGPDSDRMHVGISALAALENVDLVHTCGDQMKHLHDALPIGKRGQWFENGAAMAAEIHSLLDAGDVAMVKGSLGARVGQVVDAILALGTIDAQKG